MFDNYVSALLLKLNILKVILQYFKNKQTNIQEKYVTVSKSAFVLDCKYYHLVGEVLYIILLLHDNATLSES